MRIRGIPIRVHPSWLFIGFVFTFASQQQIETLLDTKEHILLTWSIGLLTSSLLFLSVVLHELGHSFMALREGIKVTSINLFLFGGGTRIEKQCETAMSCFRVAIIGPVISLFLAFICFSSLHLFPNSSQIVSNLLVQVGTINLILALFNLLPVLPLDGGIILNSLVWYFTGSKRKGLKFANSSSRTLSIFAIFCGSFICFKSGGLGGLWLIVIGWFGLASARSQNQIFALEEILLELKVSQAARKNFRVLEASETLKSISQLHLDNSRDKNFDEWLLICSGGRWVGYLTEKVLKNIPVQDWEKYLLSEYLRPLKELPSISEKEPIWHAVLALAKENCTRILVFNSAGLPSGTLDKADIGDAVFSRIGLKLPKAFLEAARHKNSYPLGISLKKLVDDMVSNGMVQVSNLDNSKK
ncbi:site-2 protease family protein [Prochlorococcus sp. MIT 0601]|uniref:site-2 protease family protein n=2 Tax=Prochlorococcus TaxID=1218 RepID=UPI00053370A4|nr:site-2 protease family protein [Prochlorococcus sp. MIT 0601]KGG12853.1 Metal dependent membrane associated protease [Prochlorococcus sp. MIT 0601]